MTVLAFVKPDGDPVSPDGAMAVAIADQVGAVLAAPSTAGHPNRLN